MSAFIQYCKARFPVVPLLLFSVFTMLAISAFPSTTTLNELSLGALSVLFVLFFFHLRLMDDVKDYAFDAKNFPERPLHSGLITMKDLYVYSMVASCGMATLSYLFLKNQTSAVLFFAAWGYSFLMYREFWIKDLWNKSSVLYVISHEFAMVLLYLAFISNVNPTFFHFLPSSLALLFAVFHPVLLIEFGRKISHRYDQNGLTTSDTYASKWGQETTIFLITALCFLSSILLFLTGYFNAKATLMSMIPMTSYLLLNQRFRTIFFAHAFFATALLSLAQLFLLIMLL